MGPVGNLWDPVSTFGGCNAAGLCWHTMRGAYIHLAGPITNACSAATLCSALPAESHQMHIRAFMQMPINAAE